MALYGPPMPPGILGNGQQQSPGLLGGMFGGGGGGWGHGADQYFQDNGNALMGLAAGLLQPTLPGQRGAALAQGIQGYQQGAKDDLAQNQRMAQKKGLAALMQKDGTLSPQMQQYLAASPELANMYLSQSLLNPNQKKMSDYELKKAEFENAHLGQRLPSYSVAMQKDAAGNETPLVMNSATGDLTRAAGMQPAPPTNPYAMAGKPTDVQAQAAGFADRAAAAHADLEKIGNPNEGATGWAGNALTKGPFGYNLLPGLMTSDQRQQFERAKKDFITAELRKESGAVMGATEFDTEDQKYFPQPNDSETVIKQKAIARDRAVKNLMREAGPTYKPFSAGGVGPAAPAAPGAPPAAGAALSDPVGIR